MVLPPFPRRKTGWRTTRGSVPSVLCYVERRLEERWNSILELPSPPPTISPFSKWMFCISIFDDGVLVEFPDPPSHFDFVSFFFFKEGRKKKVGRMQLEDEGLVIGNVIEGSRVMIDIQNSFSVNIYTVNFFLLSGDELNNRILRIVN